jgi:hypothetical protein
MTELTLESLAKRVEVLERPGKPGAEPVHQGLAQGDWHVP